MFDFSVRNTKVEKVKLNDVRENLKICFLNINNPRYKINI